MDKIIKITPWSGSKTMCISPPLSLCESCLEVLYLFNGEKQNYLKCSIIYSIYYAVGIDKEAIVMNK